MEVSRLSRDVKPRTGGRGQGRSQGRSSGRSSDRESHSRDRFTGRSGSNSNYNSRNSSRDSSRDSFGKRGSSRGGFSKPKPVPHTPSGESRLKGIYEESRGRRMQYFTKNFIKGQKVYTEKLINFNGVELREWIPEKSKLGAAVYNGVSQIGIKPGSKVLYIGAATGTTCSHVSDIIGKDGELYALDFAPRTQRNLVFLT